MLGHLKEGTSVLPVQSHAKYDFKLSPSWDTVQKLDKVKLNLILCDMSVYSHDKIEHCYGK